MLTLEPIDDGLGLTWNDPDAAQLPFRNDVDSEPTGSHFDCRTLRH